MTYVSAFDLQTYLGQQVDADKADKVLGMAEAFVRAYTRGRGFDEYGPNDELTAVIVSVAGRLLTNPHGHYATQTSGPFTAGYARWDGFNLLEQAVLNRYRRRAQ